MRKIFLAAESGLPAGLDRLDGLRGMVLGIKLKPYIRFITDPVQMGEEIFEIDDTGSGFITPRRVGDVDVPIHGRYFSVVSQILPYRDTYDRNRKGF